MKLIFEEIERDFSFKRVDGIFLLEFSFCFLWNCIRLFMMKLFIFLVINRVLLSLWVLVDDEMYGGVMFSIGMLIFVVIVNDIKVLFVLKRVVVFLCFF